MLPAAVLLDPQVSLGLVVAAHTVGLAQAVGHGGQGSGGDEEQAPLRDPDRLNVLLTL